MSLSTSNPRVRRYFMANVEVVRVFPSPNGCICQMPAINLEKWRITSSIETAAYENFFSSEKSKAIVSTRRKQLAYWTVSPFKTHSFLVML